MTPDVRRMLISLLRDEQKALSLSNRAFALKLDVTVPWLNRFYEDNTRVRDGTLDPVIKYFKKKTIEDLVALAEERQLNDAANELNVAGGFTTWGLPLFLLFFEKRLPKGVTVSFTKNRNDGGTATPVSEWKELVASLEAGDIPLNAPDLIRYLNQTAEEFDVVLIPEDLREDLTESGIFKIATLSTGFAVTLYVIGKNISDFDVLNGKPAADQKEGFIKALKERSQHIRTVYQLPGTAALNQWEAFLGSEIVVEGRKGENTTVVRHLPELSKQRQPIETEEAENLLEKELLNDDDLMLLVAYEPFANNFYYDNFNSDVVKYKQFNLSQWINKKVNMVLLANKTALNSKHKSAKIQELLKALQTVVVPKEYNTSQASIAELFFTGKSDKPDEWDRLQISINEITYHLEKSELSTYLFDNK